MSKTVISPVALPVVVGDYTAAVDVSGINSAMRVSFNKAALSTQGCAVFSCDDTTIAAGSITGTFSASNSATWPNAGRGVRLLGTFQGGAFNLQGAPRTYLDVNEPIEIGPGLILLRTAGTTANTVEINGAGDTVFPSASITPVALTLLERDAAGAGYLTALILGAVGATVSPSGDIRITSAAQTVLSSVDVATGAVANPLIRTDGADGMSVGPTGAGLTGSLALTCTGVMAIGDDAIDRRISIGSGTGASRIDINSGNSADSKWSVLAGGVLSLGANGTDHRVNVGNATGVSLLALTGGTGGITLTSTGAGGIVLAGGTSALNAWNGSAGGATIGICSAAFAATLNLGTGAAVIDTTIGSTNTTSTTAIRSGAGAAGVTITGGTGTSSFNVGAAGTLNIDTAATSSTLNIGTGADQKAITIGNVSAATRVRVNVGTGGFGVNVNPDASAMVDFNGTTTQGVRFPNMTEVQRDAIAAPAAGLVVYNTTTNKLNLRVAAAWEAITSA